jgi:hypothetical protein
VDASEVMSERRAVQGEFFALLLALRDSREEKLAAWAAAHAPPGNAYAIARLLDTLRKAGAAEEVLALAAWAAAHAPLGHPYATVALLKALRRAGAADQIAVLLARDPARRAPLGNPYATIALLKALRQAGATDQVLALATRAAAHAPPGNQSAIARLLNALRRRARPTRRKSLRTGRPLMARTNCHRAGRVVRLILATVSVTSWPRLLSSLAICQDSCHQFPGGVAAVGRRSATSSRRAATWLAFPVTARRDRGSALLPSWSLPAGAARAAGRPVPAARRRPRAACRSR